MNAKPTYQELEKQIADLKKQNEISRLDFSTQNEEKTKRTDELRKAKERAEESEARLVEAQAATKVGNWQTDLSSLNVIWSEETYKIFELNSQIFQASHQAFLGFVHPEDRVKVDEAFRNSFNTDFYNYIEHRIITSTGKLKYIEERWRIIRNSESQPEKAFGTCQDITTRKKAELALKEKNTLIQTILDNLPIGLALNNINEGYATYMNKKFTEIYGWPEEELTSIASFFQKVFQDETYRDPLKERVMTDVNSGIAENMHWENLEVTHKNENKRIVNVVNIPLFEQNTMVSTVMDITELKQIENELIKAKEKAEKNEQKLRLVVNSIPDTTIQLIDNELRYLICGGGENKKNNLENSLIEGRTLREAYPKDVVDLFEPIFLKALQGESLSSISKCNF